MDNIAVNNRKSFHISEKKYLKKLDNLTNLLDITDLHIEKASDFDIDFSLFPSTIELWISSKKTYQIPDSFLKLKKLDKLIINKNCLLPENIHLVKNLRELWLENKGILNIPDNIRRTESVKELIIYYYDNVEPIPVPEWIFEMKQLERLRFSVGKFTSVSEKINQLTNLTTLDFGCSLSDMKSFPDLSGLTKLKQLTVRGESVQGQKLPPYSLFSQVLDAIKNLDGLELLDLCDWRPKKKEEWLVIENKKHSIPDVFDRYPNLNELSLGGMKLDFVPNSVLQLKKLKKLNLMDNKLDNKEIRRVINHLPFCAIDSDVMYYKPKRK